LDEVCPVAPERNKSKSKGVMSVSAPFEVAAPLGGYRTVTLTQAIRVAAQLLGDATVAVSDMFTPAEWQVIAESFQNRAIEPEIPTPGYVLGTYVERASHRRVFAERLGENPQKALNSLIKRLENLSYVHAWAVIIACQFYSQFCTKIEEGDPWWRLPYRHEKIKPAQQKAG
jgi:hypothetical protein